MAGVLKCRRPLEFSRTGTTHRDPIAIDASNLLSFRHKSYRKSKKPKINTSRPLLELEVLSCHTLRQIGEALFQFHLGDILNEDLDDHLWRFSPVDHEDLGVTPMR